MAGGPLGAERQSPSAHRAITFRSVSLGLLISILIVCLTPFNEYVVNNSFLIGSYFPPIVAMAMLALVLLVNGPLHKWLPSAALSAGELAIIISMALISCSLPSQGLMRQFIPTMVSPLYFTGQDPKFDQLFTSMNLPSWMFATDDLEARSSATAVVQFYTRTPEGSSIPWHAWVRPLIGWGVFGVCFMTALICIACLIRFQWAVNERLAFPIAQLQTMLIEPPKPGKAFNSIFSSPAFWIAAVAVIVIQSSQVLKVYFPTSVPAIPSSYDLRTNLTDPPWNGFPYWLKTATIYFTLVGLSYFTPTRVSFSLWGGALIMGLIRWPLNQVGDTTLSDAAMADQQFGAAFAFLGGLLWIGRHHWMVIARAVVGRQRPGDAQGAFLHYRPAAILLLLSMAGMAAWFMVIGCVWWLACCLVLTILMAHLITARLVAETGLAYVRMPVNFDQLLTNFPATAITPKDAYVYGLGHYNFMQAARESTLVFALHGLQTVNDSDVPERDKRRTVPLLMSTLIVAGIACAMASIWCYYSYAIPMDDAQQGVLNVWGTQNWPKTWLVDFPKNVENGAYPSKSHSSWTHMGIGIAVTTILQALSWRFASWPLLPVGYLLCTYFYITGAAFSLFIGWLAKTLILRFGGATLFNNMKPLFIGLIFGEALSMGLWLIITTFLAANGYPFYVVRFLPQ